MILLKLKVQPEDFVVKELIDLPYDARGRYRIYLLRKRSWNTMDALRHIARASRVPLSLIGSGGRKDRHALTFQYLSVPREHELRLPEEFKGEESNLELSFVGYADDYVSPARLQGNYFEITLRQLSPAEQMQIQVRSDEVREFGYANYFDDQRFGSVETAEEFFAERVIKKHYRGALKLYFTTIHPEDKKEEKERKRKIEELWGNWEAILPLCRSPIEQEAIGHLLTGERKGNLVAALNAIPKEELSMFFSAYQSFLWNETLRRILQRLVRDLRVVKGKIAPYFLYRTLTPWEKESLTALQIPTVSSRIPPARLAVGGVNGAASKHSYGPQPGITPRFARFPASQSDSPGSALDRDRRITALVDEVIREVLAGRGVQPGDFNLRVIRKSFFKSFYRPAIVWPQNLYLGPFADDELYPGQTKVKMKFTLPPGSFATMLIKAMLIV